MVERKFQKKGLEEQKVAKENRIAIFVTQTFEYCGIGLRHGEGQWREMKMDSSADAWIRDHTKVLQ